MTCNVIVFILGEENTPSSILYVCACVCVCLRAREQWGIYRLPHGTYNVLMLAREGL